MVDTVYLQFWYFRTLSWFSYRNGPKQTALYLRIASDVNKLPKLAKANRVYEIFTKAFNYLKLKMFFIYLLTVYCILMDIFKHFLLWKCSVKLKQSRTLLLFDDCLFFN